MSDASVGFRPWVTATLVDGRLRLEWDWAGAASESGFMDLGDDRTLEIGDEHPLHQLICAYVDRLVKDDRLPRGDFYYSTKELT